MLKLTSRLAKSLSSNNYYTYSSTRRRPVHQVQLNDIFPSFSITALASALISTCLGIRLFAYAGPSRPSSPPSTIHRPTNVKCLIQEAINCEDESEHYDKRRMIVMMMSSSVAIGYVGKTKKISNARALNTGDEKTAVMAWKARYNL